MKYLCTVLDNVLVKDQYIIQGGNDDVRFCFIQSGSPSTTFLKSESPLEFTTGSGGRTNVSE